MPDMWAEVRATAALITSALDHRDEARKLMNEAEQLLNEGADHQLDAVYASLLRSYRDVPLIWEMFKEHFSTRPDVVRPDVARRFVRAMPRTDEYAALAAKVANYHLDRSARPGTPASAAHSSARVTLAVLKLLEQNELFETVCRIYSRIFGGASSELLDSLSDEGAAPAAVVEIRMPGPPVPRPGPGNQDSRAAGNSKSPLMRLKASNQ